MCHDLHCSRHSQTLAARGRRGTGKLKNRISYVPESSPVTPASLLQRSATTRETNTESLNLSLPYQQRKLDISLDSVRSGEGEDSSAITEEEEEGTYESVEDFLTGSHSRDPYSGTTPDPSLGQQTIPPRDPGTTPSRDSYIGSSPGRDGGPAPPPQYTPPPPPPGRTTEGLDHEYTPVKITEDGEVQVKREEEEEVWGELPLKTSPQPTKRTTASPGRAQGISASVPHVKPFTTSPARGLMIPPEPSSPPPSPPAPGRKMPPPTPRSRVTDSETDGPTEQPKLPPKKRRELAKLYSDLNIGKGSPPNIPAPVQVRPAGSLSVCSN